jgi:hypothetical protein
MVTPAVVTKDVDDLLDMYMSNLHDDCMANLTERLIVLVSKDDMAQLRERAATQGRSLGFVTRQAVMQWLAHEKLLAAKVEKRKRENG